MSFKCALGWFFFFFVNLALAEYEKDSQVNMFMIRNNGWYEVFDTMLW